MLAGMVKVPAGGRLGMPTRAVVLPSSTSIAARALWDLVRPNFHPKCGGHFSRSLTCREFFSLNSSLFSHKDSFSFPLQSTARPLKNWPLIIYSRLLEGAITRNKTDNLDGQPESRGLVY